MGPDMVNWRKPLIYAAHYLTRNDSLRNFRYLRSIEHLSPKQLQRLQEEKLRKLLLHAFGNVPYYRDILSDVGVIKNKQICLENFEKIPFLTKAQLAREADRLRSNDYEQRNYYVNHTGGSTGQPVTFIQDREYKCWSMAHQYYSQWICGLEPGEATIKIWGSERDVFRSSEKLSSRLQRGLFNTTVLNGFLMSEQRMADYVTIWNRIRPKVITAYTSCILEFARYVKLSKRKVFKPLAIICCAETLTEDIRSYIEQVFSCPAINFYGARDAGTIACECENKKGLHVFELENKVEIVDRRGRMCETGQIGDIAVTTLNNFSMPLIRYKIGDTAVGATSETCTCGRGWPLIEKLTGRSMDIFRTKQGTAVPAEFFIHAIGVVYNRDFIKQFQVVQKDYDHILVKLVLTDPEQMSASKGPLTKTIQKVMGSECRVDFELLDDIPPTPSGKYRYTISKVAPA